MQRVYSANGGIGASLIVSLQYIDVLYLPKAWTSSCIKPVSLPLSVCKVRTWCPTSSSLSSLASRFSSWSWRWARGSDEAALACGTTSTHSWVALGYLASWWVCRSFTSEPTVLSLHSTIANAIQQNAISNQPDRLLTFIYSTWTLVACRCSLCGWHTSSEALLSLYVTQGWFCSYKYLLL